MKRIVLTLITTLVAVMITSAKQIEIDGGNVTFNAPDEFTPLSQELINLKYPSSRAPKYVIGNESGATTIAYDLKDNPIHDDQLEEVREAFTQMFPRMIPGLEWKENKIIELAGRRWGYMEMTSHAIDTDIYNIMLFTGYIDKMLIFNFNSTKEEFKKYEEKLRASLKSIQIK